MSGHFSYRGLSLACVVVFVAGLAGGEAFRASAAEPGKQAKPPVAKPEPKKSEKPKKPFSKKALIEPLLDKLAQSTDAETAKAIAEAVQKLWNSSGSPTVDVLMGRVSSAAAKRDLETALSLLDAVVEIAPKYAEGWNQRATMLFLKQSYDASIADIGKVLELQPRHFGALSGLGLVMKALGDKKSALAAFRRALQVHPFLTGPNQAVKELEPEVEGRGI